MSSPAGPSKRLYSDEALVAFDKPSGLLTIPGRDLAAPSLWRLAEGELGARLWAVHRLDRETSGAVLFARSAEVHQRLNQAFEHRQVAKTYLARVAPPPAAPSGELRHQLVPARRGFMRVAPDGESGQLAETDYRVLEVRDGIALVELRPRTGRTHQLRLQLAAIGSPIEGEPHYRPLERPEVRALAAERLWLHALRLELVHPATGGRLVIEAPPPNELRGL